MHRDRPSRDLPVERLAAWQAAVFGCLCASGVAALIAQVCWIRRAALVFGSTVYALATVLAVFFLGLALGGLFFGEWSRRLARPLRAYALLEIALALFVVATLPLFDAAESLHAGLYRAVETPGPLVYATRGALVGLVLLGPTLLMGGTLPLVCRQLVAARASIGRVVARLYAVNTLGGAVGAALCGFVLLPVLGMRRSLLLAAALDLLAGIVVAAVGWQRTAPAAAPERRQSAPARTVRGVEPATRHTALVAVLFFTTGFVALGNEVLWTRFLAVVTPSTVLSYATALTVVLVGIVIGSRLVVTVVDRGWPRARVFGALMTASGLAALASMLLPVGLWRALGDWSAPALLLLPPAVLSGAAFPVAVRMVVDEPALAGSAVGRMTAVNTLGGIAGSLLVGFFALPRLGLQTSLMITSGLAVAAGCAAWWRLDRGARVAPRVLAVAACVLVWLVVPHLLGTRVPQDLLAAPHELVDYREGRESNLAVIRRQGGLQLEADRWWQGQDRKTHQVLAAHVPLLLHPAPRRVLVVGVGAGQTPASVLRHDVERLDCVDIEPAIFDLIGRHFDGAWTRDPRVRLLADDGRSYVAYTAERYDVIALEVGQIFRPGVASFYSADFYRLARARLAPGGILSQFVPLPFLTPDTFRSVVATFLEAFPQSILWYNTAELLLLGVNRDRIALPAARLDLLTSNPGVQADLRYSHWDGPRTWLNQPHVFLGGFLVGPAGLAAIAAGAPIERDDRPELAYASRRARAAATNELPILEILRPHLEPLASVLAGDVPEDTLEAAALVRERNLADIVASAYLRRVNDALTAGRDAEAAELLETARRANPENVQVHRLAGERAFRQQRPAEADVHYTRALTIAPDDGATQLALARLLHLTGRVPEAVQHYRAALAERPNDAEAHNDLAAALFQQGDLDGAERELTIALRLSPAYGQAQTNLARLQATRRASP